eukprot:6388273-Alexandrium_andersonii.AAC.1
MGAQLLTVLGQGPSRARGGDPNIGLLRRPPQLQKGEDNSCDGAIDASPPMRHGQAQKPGADERP